MKSGGAIGFLGTLQEASRRGQIAFAQTGHPCIVIKAEGETLIPGSLDARDGLSRQCLGPIGLQLIETHQKEDQAGSKQAVVAGAPGTFHRGFAVRNATIRLSGEVEDGAHGIASVDEQAILPQLFCDLHGFFAKAQRQLRVDPAGDHCCARQRCGPQSWISPRFGSLQHRNEHTEHQFPLRVLRPETDKSRREPQDLLRPH